MRFSGLLRSLEYARARFRGAVLALLVALAASFLSTHYGAPAMLLAVLLGLSLHFLSEDPKHKLGLDFAARTLLRLGVALLGLRISLQMFRDLGLPILSILMLAVALTIAFGIWAARALGKGAAFGVLTGGAVAICGASAAMALAAVLPARDAALAEKRMVFTVFGVTLLSTLSMIFYPIAAEHLGFSEALQGVFLGATIHDVAQVVGAGFSVSERSGDVAVLVKLIRVALLAPVVLIVSLASRSAGSGVGKRPPLLPGFVIAFALLATLNSLVPVPALLKEYATGLSRWSLLTAIAAVGIKTSLAQIAEVGRRSILLLVLETLFLAALVAAALHWIPTGI